MENKEIEPIVNIIIKINTKKLNTENFNKEVSEILRKSALDIENGERPKKLFDIDNNKVGDIKFEGRTKHHARQAKKWRTQYPGSPQYIKVNNYIQNLIQELENFKPVKKMTSNSKLEFDFMKFKIQSVLSTIHYAEIVDQDYVDKVNKEIDEILEKIYKKYKF